jgi:hypothetical protein
MQYEEALSIVRSLAGGINPITKEPIPSDSVYNDPIIIRALYTVTDSKPLKSKKIKTAIPKNVANNAGKKWNKEDEKALIEAFKEGLTDIELANKFGRSKFAINSKLVKLDQIDGNKPPAKPNRVNKTKEIE